MTSCTPCHCYWYIYFFIHSWRFLYIHVNSFLIAAPLVQILCGFSFISLSPIPLNLIFCKSQLLCPDPPDVKIPNMSKQTCCDVSWYDCQQWTATKQPMFFSESKVHGVNIGPTWVLSAPDGPHVCPMNLAIRVLPCIHYERTVVYDEDWLYFLLLLMLSTRLLYIQCDSNGVTEAFC